MIGDMAQQMTQGESLIRAELRALVEEYAVITDALDYDAWVNLFIPDGEFSPRNAGEDEPFVVWRGEHLKEVLHNNDQWERTFQLHRQPSRDVRGPGAAEGHHVLLGAPQVP